jgi:hypothetical protein
MQPTQPTYKISGKNRQEAKFVHDCLKRIIKFYENDENKDILGTQLYIIIDILTPEATHLEQKLSEKFE